MLNPAIYSNIYDKLIKITVSSYFQSRLTVQHCYKELKTFGTNSLQGSNEINSPFALIYRHNNQIGLEC